MKYWNGYRWVEKQEDRPPCESPPEIVQTHQEYGDVFTHEERVALLEAELMPRTITDEGAPHPHVFSTQHEVCRACDAPAGVECEINPAHGTLYVGCQSRMGSWTDLGYDEEDIGKGLPSE